MSVFVWLCLVRVCVPVYVCAHSRIEYLYTARVCGLYYCFAEVNRMFSTCNTNISYSRHGNET